MSPPSIAIIGAGPAGLTLANLLLPLTTTNQITLKIYDLDPSATSRADQGGCLDLHPNDGLAALDKCGLLDRAKPLLRYEGEELTIADLNGTRYIHMTEAPDIEGHDARPEIDREQLKGILLDGVKQWVTWGKKLTRVDEARRVLVFEDGSEAGPFSLVVGADGAWSKIRSVLTDVRPVYSGICGFEGNVPVPVPEAVSKMVGRGSYFAVSGGRGLTGQRQGNDSVKIGMWLKRDQNFVDELWSSTGGRQDELKAAVLQEYAEWSEDLRNWVKCCQVKRKWVLHELPVGTTWDHKEGWTLIGDAAHLCTPFAGLGVNAAMKDALELVELIEKAVKEEITLDKAVEDYEKGMFPRAKTVQDDTMTNKIGMYSQDAPIGFLAGMVKVVGREVGWPVDRGVLYYVPISKTAYGVFWLRALFGRFLRAVTETFVKQKQA